MRVSVNGCVQASLTGLLYLHLNLRKFAHFSDERNDDMNINELGQLAITGCGGAAIGIFLTYANLDNKLRAMRNAMENAINVSASRYQSIQSLTDAKNKISKAFKEALTERDAAREELASHKDREARRNAALAKGRETIANKRAANVASGSGVPITKGRKR